MKEVSFFVKLALIIIIAVVVVNFVFIFFTGKPLFLNLTGKT
jgi:hypothetical protein